MDETSPETFSNISSRKPDFYKKGRLDPLSKIELDLQDGGRWNTEEFME